MVVFRYAVNLLLVFFALSSCVTSQTLQQINEDWYGFKSRYNRTYSSQNEEQFRYSVFAQNAKKIFRHNLAADEGRYTYWMKINNFADMTDDEFIKYFTGSTISVNLNKLDQKTTTHFNLSLPRQIDWRQQNCVTDVKTQGVCGSCYAFAATGALESHQCIKTGKLVSLSEQNITDCTSDNLYWNNGCIGGQAENAFQYVIDNGGIDTEKSYPYTGLASDCKFKKDAIGATANDYIDIPINEKIMQEIVAGVGPVAVCVDSRGMTFYSHGVYDGRYEEKGETRTCSPSDVNHAMLVIGYGSTPDGKYYWLIKNSWGESWGENGYIKLVRNYKNTCGVSTLASYPII